MACTVSIQVSVPLVSLDGQGNSHAMMATVEPGRVPGELKITFQAADLTQIATDGGSVYLAGSDFAQAQTLLASAASLVG